jgi:hypothetical protein
LETFLENNNVTGLKTSSDELEQELGYCVKLFVIMHADDTALLAESAGFQDTKNLLLSLKFLSPILKMNACWQSSLGINHKFCFIYIYLSFHLMQYSWNIFTILCQLPADSAKRAVSSACIITNNLTQ